MNLHRVTSSKFETPQKVIFLDRDGTIIVDKNYLSRPEDVELEIGCVEGLTKFSKAGYLLIGVTNQSGVGRGFFSLADVNQCNNRVESLLSPHGIYVSAWYICPHRPEEDCNCRKPRSGLVEQAEAIVSIDYSRSFVIGDKDADVMLGRNCGMESILVLSGAGRIHLEWAREHGYMTAATLDDAADLILSRPGI
ncbi:D-glycero-alpha-D-manno-heptose-1,7-bisphosphate 7-phosphatase [Agrobacterium vitis]|uniref:D,D-heptose 1,7-bisphosphate phosphatase n=1 Tax=Agrobacterium vitis TaxID=373 RepID=A0A7K1RND4_AGRVI|nr:HAD family hydrolase [Agrobacterium vitis]MVA59550.1 HAD-IIIA family hydrolase [Agrobacterium vitis]